MKAAEVGCAARAGEEKTATANTPSSADRLFDEKYLLLASVDRDEVVDGCTRALRPHKLLVRDPHAQLGSRLHHVPVGSFSLNRLRYGADVTVAPATPEEDNFLVTLPLDGTARFSYGSQSVDLGRGRGAVVSPYRAFRFDIDAVFDQIILRLDRRRVEAVGASLLGVDEAVPVDFDLALSDMPAFWHNLLEAAVALAAFETASSYPRLFAQLEELVIESLLLAQPNSLTATRASGLPMPSPRLRKAMDYMREHIAEPVRMADVARHCGTSLRSLQARFHRDLGMSPRQWLQTRRLECAYATLAAAAPGTVTVTDVALRWGFFHLGEFSVRFRDRFGRKPSSVLAEQ